ncbi:respiratory nitrate reductase subunit gamma [Streptomyces anthocyanicus]|uniref:respiratory nitrate reductase subunit gamma n=1 Tax=Streptomyces anthocyanicus TaxID=68174 RepID=UPI0038B5BE62
MLALPAGGGYDYRGTVSVWFRGLFALGPRPEVIADAPLLFRPHTPSACPLFAARPFTRLVHVWSAPVGYWSAPARSTGAAPPPHGPHGPARRPGGGPVTTTG